MEQRRIYCQSPPKIDKVHTERINVRTNLFVENQDTLKRQKISNDEIEELVPDSTSDSFVNNFANLSPGEKERLFPELKTKTPVSTNINVDLMNFVKTMVIYTANDKRRLLKMQPIVDEWALFFMDLMREFQAKHNCNTNNFDEAIEKEKMTPTWK